MEVVTRPHLMSHRDTARVTMPAGRTIEEMFVGLQWPVGFRPYTRVLINGYMIEPKHWERIRPKEKAEVVFAVVPHGGAKGKQILALVAAIVVAVAAPYLAGQVVGLYTGLAAYETAIAAGIAIVGSLIIGAIFKPPTPKTLDSNAENSKTYSITGQSNQVRPYGVVPKIYGMHRVYPDLAALPYTFTSGFDQYIVMLFCVGHGPLGIWDLRIGENSLGFYSDINCIIHEEFRQGDALQLFPNDVKQEAFSLELKQNIGIEVTTQVNCNWAIVDVSFPRGLGIVDKKGATNPTSMDMQVEWRPKGEANWRPAGAAWPSASPGVVRSYGYARIYAQPIYQTATGWTGGSGSYNYQILAGYGIPKDSTMVTVREWSSWERPMAGGIASYLTEPIANTTYLDQDRYWHMTPSNRDMFTGKEKYPVMYFQNGGAMDWNIGTGTQRPFTASLTLRFPQAGQYEIRFIRITDNPDPNNSLDLRYAVLTALRSFSAIPPVRLPAGKSVSLVELQMKASEQISGTIDNFSCMAISKLPTFDGANWTAPVATTNPAWAYADVLRSNQNKNPAPDSRIDGYRLLQWSWWSDTVEAPFSFKNAEFNFVVDKEYTTWDLLSIIAGAARAAPTMRDNKYSVIYDVEQQSPVQIFTPRNSWGFQATRKYLDVPHAFRTKFMDQFSDYKQNEVVVPTQGYGEPPNLTPTKFEDYNLIGVTNWEQAIRLTRYMYAQGVLRQETFSIQVDIENLVCLRGDLVAVQHDVLTVGGANARIINVTGNSIRVDTDISLFETPYGVIFRSDRSKVSQVIPATVEGSDTFILSVMPADIPQVGDLVVYGTVGRVAGEYLVKNIDPGNDFVATLILQELGRGVYQADRGYLPPYKPQPGSVQILNPNPPRNLILKVSSSFVNRYPFAQILAQWDAPDKSGGGPQPKYYVLFRRSTNTSDGQTIVELDTSTDLSEIVGKDIEQWRLPTGGQTYEYGVCAQYSTVRSETIWAQCGVLTVNPEPPAAATNLIATPLFNGIRLQWDASSDPLFAYYETQVNTSGVWIEDFHTSRKIKSNVYAYAPEFLAGDYYALVRIQDTYGLSGPAIAVPFTVLAPIAVAVTADPVVNTVFLKWGTLSTGSEGNWTAQTTFQVEYYDVRKRFIATPVLASKFANIMAAPFDHIGIAVQQQILRNERARRRGKAEDAYENVGQSSTEYTALNEARPGTWEYCVRAVDIAGNVAPWACVQCFVESPDNYVLLDSDDNVLDLSTYVNEAFEMVEDRLIFPVLHRTWEEHFVQLGFITPQDQINAGWPIYIQPGDNTGVITWEYDYGKKLPSLRISFFLSSEEIAPSCIINAVLYTKVDVADPWVALPQDPIKETQALPVNTRYVKIVVEIETSADRKGLVYIDKLGFKIDVRYLSEAGNVWTDASGQVHVPFNQRFIDIISVQLTSGTAGVAYCIYQVDPNTGETYVTGMMVYTRNTQGNPVGGLVSWNVTGY